MKSKSIFVNQIGYVCDGAKYAYIRAEFASENDVFYVKECDSHKTVFTGKFLAAPQDEITGEKILKADFSDCKECGKFYVECDADEVTGGAESYPFEISNSSKELFGDLYYSVLKYFYLSRCGQDIDGKDWSHPACHTGIAEVYGTGQKVSVNGGWHDAGDYGRYIVAGSKAVMDLLLAYEANKSYSEYDILGEVRFELEWMLQLQREDGGVYHKISCYHFCPFINPQEEKDQLVLAPVSTAATADFAGCLAFASKFYKEKDLDFAEKLVSAALKAQDYLDTHEDEFYKNPQEITTGGYGDWNVKDERFFALCSLFAVTGNVEFLNKALAVKQAALALPEDKEHPWVINWIEAFSWGCVSSYGTEILIKNEDLVRQAVVSAEGTLEQAESIISEMKNAIIKRAEEILERCNNNPFGLGLKFVFWGSNGNVADEAHFLLLAHDLTGRKEFLEAAKRHFDYILGCNPINICYVTGSGTECTKNPHHRPSGAVKKTMPGMLAGGPSAGLHDEVAKKYLPGKPPLSCYIDLQGSYSTNEVAIYWNSPFVYLMAKLGLV